jgi:orotate phosphoribosyltransferase
MSSPNDLLAYLKKDECYLENGHFKLPSGKHSDSYIQARIGMMNPQTCHAFATEIARNLADVKPTVLASSTVGGILLAKVAANILRIPLLVGRQNAGSVTWVGIEKHSHDALSRIVLVDDILMTGGTLRSSIQSLGKLDAKIIAAVVAVDRSDRCGERESKVQVDGFSYEVSSLLHLSLNVWNPGNCPICPKPYINLYNAEQDFIQGILSMPSRKAGMIIEGYKEAYDLQGDEEQLKMINQWEPWILSLHAGLPRKRVSEDFGLVNFIRRLSQDEREDRKRVLSDLVGHLLAVSNIRVEARSLGCSILVGEKRNLCDMLEVEAPIEVPKSTSTVSFDSLDKLIPYYDALQETEAVFLFNRDGDLIGIRRLVRSGESGETRGIPLLRQVTKESDSIGLVLRRKRKAIAVYRKGRLQAEAVLSEKTGIWEFTTPHVLEEIISLKPSIEPTLEMVLEISREMVIKGYGGLFVIGSKTPKHGPPKIEMKPVPLTRLGVGMASEIAKLDGAMFISEDGYVQIASVIINYIDNGNIISHISKISPPSKEGGARRKAALRTSIECPETVIVSVSQNGTIDIFKNGNSWSVSESISGVSR